MTPDQRYAREVAEKVYEIIPKKRFKKGAYTWYLWHDELKNAIVQAILAAIQKEREGAAKTVEAYGDAVICAERIAQAIRSRGKE